MASMHNFTCDQGATFSREIILKDSGGTVIDITGATAEMDVREKVNSTTTLVELSTSNGRIVVDGPNGKLTLTIAAADTALLTTLCAVYDLKITYISGEVARLLEGTFTLDLEVTHS